MCPTQREPPPAIDVVDDVDDDVEGHDSENDDDDEKVTWRLGDLQIICNSDARVSQAEGELGARHLAGQHNRGGEYQQEHDVIATTTTIPPPQPPPPSSPGLPSQ